MECIHKKRVCDVALACRRVGSKRVKALSSSKTLFYDKNISYRQNVLLQDRTFVLNSYILCCIYNVGARAYDESEYLDPCDLYNDCMYEYQQVQSVYDSDGHEAEVLSGDETSVCDSSGSFPESVCGGHLNDLSGEAMDTLINQSVDGCEEVSARRELTVTSHAQNVGDEVLESEGKLSKNDYDIHFALDDLHDRDRDKFSDTGYMHDQEIIPEHAGVRGPQSASILYPHDCKKLVQVCRGI